jgi:predicted dinucleotide-binding enzyme
MDIGIIGSGQIGGVLARRFRALGHRVAIANSRGPHSLTDFADEVGAAAATVREAVIGRDLVVVTIPMVSVAALPRDIFAGAGDAVVVDTCNYFPQQRDGRIGGIENGEHIAESVWVSQQIGRPVVKAFNTIGARFLMHDGAPRGDLSRIALPVAGDWLRDKTAVMGLTDDLGFDPVDAGSLAESWRQQPASPCFVANLSFDRIGAALCAATPDRPPHLAGTPQSPGDWDDPR